MRPPTRAVAEAALELDPLNPARRYLEHRRDVRGWMRRVDVERFFERYASAYETRRELVAAAARRFGVCDRTVWRWAPSLTPSLVGVSAGLSRSRRHATGRR